MRLLYLAGGFLCVGMGWIGLVTPGLPGTVFFIAAAACFSRSNPRLEQWVLDLPAVGPMVRDYRAGFGMPRSAKIVAVSCITAACFFSVGFVIGPLWVRLLVAAIGAYGVWFVAIHVPTREKVLAALDEVGPPIPSEPPTSST